MPSVVLDIDQRRLVVRKSYAPSSGSEWAWAAAAERHRREVEWLHAAGNLPVVKLRSVDGRRLTMTTDYAGASTLWIAGRRPAVAASAIDELLRVLTELRRAGLTHGNLGCDHVVVAGRRVTLCSPSVIDDPDPGIDMVGLATIIRQLIALWIEIGVWPEGHDRWREVASAIEADPTGSPERLRSTVMALADDRPTVGRQLAVVSRRIRGRQSSDRPYRSRLDRWARTGER